jgi:hypothetical protein
MDQRHSNMGSVVTSAVRGAWAALANMWRTLLADDVKVYRPEAYYMRGPGPKWREKHAQRRGSVLR